MMKPYSIGLRGSKGPVSIVVNAPAIDVTAMHWKTRIAWAYRCLRGRAIPVAPTVEIRDCDLTMEPGEREKGDMIAIRYHEDESLDQPFRQRRRAAHGWFNREPADEQKVID